MSSQAESSTDSQLRSPSNTRGLRAALIFGGDHSVYKTMIATALCLEVEERHAQETFYLQPVSGEADSDISHHIEDFCDATIERIRPYNAELRILTRWTHPVPNRTDMAARRTSTTKMLSRRSGNLSIATSPKAERGMVGCLSKCWAVP